MDIYFNLFMSEISGSWNEYIQLYKKMPKNFQSCTIFTILPAISRILPASRALGYLVFSGLLTIFMVVKQNLIIIFICIAMLINLLSTFMCLLSICSFLLEDSASSFPEY